MASNLNTNANLQNRIMHFSFLIHILRNSYERQCILFYEDGQHVLKAISNFCQDSNPDTITYLLTYCATVISQSMQLHPGMIKEVYYGFSIWVASLL